MTGWQVRTARLPGDGEMLDRVVIGDHYAMLLDGASAFTPISGSPADYVDALARGLTAALAERGCDLRDLLATALGAFTPAVDPLAQPSSTVSIVRWGADAVDVLVLGDSPVHVLLTGAEEATVEDPRLEQVTRAGRRTYEERLATGAGFDHGHRRLVAESQHVQFRLRNVPGGYWIAASDPDAACHAVVRSFPRDRVEAVVVLSDGVSENLRYSSISSPAALAGMTQTQLLDLTGELAAWERQVDPDGLLWPRSKRSDDKSIVVLIPDRAAQIVGGAVDP